METKKNRPYRHLDSCDVVMDLEAALVEAMKHVDKESDLYEECIECINKARLWYRQNY